MKKKISALLALVLSILLLCSCTATASPASAASAEAAEPVVYSDVPQTAWFYDSVQYVGQNNLMGGVGEGRFAPDGAVTRAMLVTILHRMEGSPKGAADAGFSDVKPGAYYADAVSWAAENGIVNGVSETAFAPGKDITREQLAAILFRYANYGGVNTEKRAELAKYTDAGKVSAYALDAMRWANAEGYLGGTSDTTLSPQGTTTRAQAATIITRYCEAVRPAETKETTEPIEEKPQEKQSASAEPTSSKEPTTPQTPVTEPSIVVENVSAKAGEKGARVAVRIQNNPGILGMAFSVNYDEQVLQLVSAKCGTAVQDVLTFTPGKVLCSGCKFLWDGMELSEEDIRDGEILVLTFDVAEAAPAGACPIVLAAGKSDFIDKNTEKCDVSLQSGAVVVTP